MINEVLKYLISFSIFVVLQSVCLNGIYESFKGSAVKDEKTGETFYDGMILYMIAPRFFEKHRTKYWSKVYTCVRCISGWGGTVIFWSIVLPVFGFYYIELIIWVFDVFALVYLNKYFYDKG